MPALPRRDALLKLIEKGMKQLAPRTYRAAKAQGVLKQVISDRADLATETYDRLWNEAALHAASASRSLSPWERVQEAVQGRNRAAEAAISQSIEFAEEVPG